MPPLDPDQQRQFALDVVAKLRAEGFEAYWAGGCVRDQLAGRTPKDYDVATNARPEQIVRVFGRRTHEVGAAFGVVAVIGGKAAGQVEVATFRQDAAYSDGRRPDSVAFSSAERDAQRRDFTINGLFYDPLTGAVIDYVGGQADLRAGLVRAIGDPRERIREDKLRMLRAVRIAATFDFTIEPATFQAIQDLAGEVTIVSPERIAQEMRGMLPQQHRVRACRLLRDSGLAPALAPELVPLMTQPLDPAIPEGETVWDRTLTVLDVLHAPSFPLALAALLHAVGERVAAQVCRRWRLSIKEQTRVTWLIARQASLVDAAHQPWPRVQRLLIAEGASELLDLHAALAHAAEHDLKHVDFCRHKLGLPAADWNPPPLIGGDDLLRHGLAAGPVFQRLLEQVRDAQLEGAIRTPAEALALVDRLLAAG